jgi:hypothetical protein
VVGAAFLWQPASAAATMNATNEIFFIALVLSLGLSIATGRRQQKT